MDSFFITKSVIEDCDRLDVQARRSILRDWIKRVEVWKTAYSKEVSVDIRYYWQSVAER